LNVRTRWKIALLVPLAALLPMLMGPTGGLPVRPTFQQETLSLPGADNTLRYFASGAAADQKNTLVRTNTSGTFTVSTASDAVPTTAVTNALQVNRSGAAVSSINLGNATDNPSFGFLGTGTSTFGGPLTVQSGASSFSSTGITLSVVGTSSAEFMRLNGVASTGYLRLQEASTDRAFIGYGSAR
jgi:hypothetical protein